MCGARHARTHAHTHHTPHARTHAHTPRARARAHRHTDTGFMELGKNIDYLFIFVCVHARTHARTHAHTGFMNMMMVIE